jgi:transposase
MNESMRATNEGGMSNDRKASPEQVRVASAQRDQIEWRRFDVDGLIDSDHRARTIWAAVEEMDLKPFYDGIASRGSEPGRPALDPKVLLALWLYATSEGVGSARHLARLCERDQAYMWICGGLRPNHHSLSDFRVEHGDKLDALLTQMLATLMAAKLLKLRRVAQDGTRARASAGASSFRRASTLKERCLAEATAQVEALKREVDEDPAASNAREKSAQERAARERKVAIENAIAQLPLVQAAHERTQRKRAREARRKGSDKPVDEKKSEPRVSTTDPEARVMKMGDGGFRPAYNLQFATDTEARVIVGVEVTNEGTDKAQMKPMIEQIEKRTGKRPLEHLVDGGYTKLEEIDAVEASGTAVYAPVPEPRGDGDPYERKRDDTDRTAVWRARMKTDEAKEIYKERAAVAETVHADLRTWRGLRQLPVRGKKKVRAVALLLALTHNLLRVAALRRAA